MRGHRPLAVRPPSSRRNAAPPRPVHPAPRAGMSSERGGGPWCAWPPAPRCPPSVSRRNVAGALPLSHTLSCNTGEHVSQKRSCVFYKQSWKKCSPLHLGIFGWQRGRVSHATLQQEECLFPLFLSNVHSGLGSNPNHCFLKNYDSCSSKEDRLSWEDVVLVRTSDAQECENVADEAEG